MARPPSPAPRDNVLYHTLLQKAREMFFNRPRATAAGAVSSSRWVLFLIQNATGNLCEGKQAIFGADCPVTQLDG
jgi:hypothetical protein